MKKIWIIIVQKYIFLRKKNTEWIYPVQIILIKERSFIHFKMNPRQVAEEVMEQMNRIPVWSNNKILVSIAAEW